MRFRSALQSPVGCAGLIAILLASAACPVLVSWGLLRWTSWPWWAVLSVALVAGPFLSLLIMNLGLGGLIVTMSAWQQDEDRSNRT